MQINSVGSICSGIESASVAWQPLGFKFDWFSEIAPFPSKLLQQRYQNTPNLGDMTNIAAKIMAEEIQSPDLICGGTPCQAFSFAGYKRGLEDDRGNLTLTFLDILDANDTIRCKKGQDATIMLWENVVGVLSDKTNAFGCFLAQLTGVTDLMQTKKWPQAGVIHGTKRNVAWRVLDAKYFGVPQQRKRIYVLAGGKDFFPENILFDTYMGTLPIYPDIDLSFDINNHHFEVFRAYTDCVYAAYGTKWNGNAAAYNGSLFVVQDQKLRRLSILEVERLMGFPDHYTNLENSSNTQRYKAVGNAWAVPVIAWLGERLLKYECDTYVLDETMTKEVIHIGESNYFDFARGIVPIRKGLTINCTTTPSKCTFKTVQDIVTSNVSNELYISSKGAQGILRRAATHNIKINPRLSEFLLKLSNV